MQIIISDSSCLIDLHKASLLEAFIRLPYDICVPDVIFESELLSLSNAQKNALKDAGLRILELPGDGILSVQNLRREKPVLSVNDCFACILAQRYSGCILLTGDSSLRAISEERGIKVHGIFWSIDEIHNARTATVKDICNALDNFATDATVRLPENILRATIKKYNDLL